MRHKRLKLSAVLLLGFGLTGLQAQTMHVTESAGKQIDYALSDIQKISFSSGNLTVIKTDNSSGVYALSDLRFLNFLETPTSIDQPLSALGQMLSVYPNPVSNTLNIVLTGAAHEEGSVSIFNLEGKTVFSRQISNAGVISLDISHLPKGIYLCRYGNASVLKTVKIVKQ